MKHFPIFLDLDGRRILVSGAGDWAVPKLRLLHKTGATIVVYGEDPVPEVCAWAMEGRLVLHARQVQEQDIEGATLCYCANGDATEDARVAAIAKSGGALVNIVDNLDDSEFITPAIVDRDPVTVAIGTEGAAPVLARRIKADLEASLPTSLGLLARISQGFRSKVSILNPGRQRREFWSRFLGREGPDAVAKGGEAEAHASLARLLEDFRTGREDAGKVYLVGAGPGDADMLTLKARRVLDIADTVIHDSSLPDGILELGRREAKIIAVDERGLGPNLKPQEAVATAAARARTGEIVVMLKSGDPVVFDDLEIEFSELENSGVDWEIVPGVAVASAAAAAIGRSLSCFGRNSSIRYISERQLQAFSERDWREIAQPGMVSAIYVKPGAARLVQGRLLMFGAPEATTVSLVENVSLRNQKVVETTLLGLADVLERESVESSMLVLLGLPPRNQIADTAVAIRSEGRS